MIVLMVLYSVLMPVNAYDIMIEIMRMTNLDIVETNWLMEMIINLTYLPSFMLQFEEVGYNTTTFLIELGPLFFLIVGSALYVLVKALLQCSVRKSESKNCVVRRIKQKSNYRAAIIRFFLEGCIELGLIAMISIVRLGKENWATWQDSLSTICGMFTLLALFFAPIKLGQVAGQYYQVKKPKIAGATTTSQVVEAENHPYAPFMKDFKRHEKKSLWYAVIFFYRRFCVLLVIVLLPINRNT